MNAVTGSGGSTLAQMRYKPFGEKRWSNNEGVLGTKRFNGNNFEEGLKIYYYGARWYYPTVGRFLSADTVVPSPSTPQNFNRYTYVLNQPLNGTDPDGHCYPLCTVAAGALIGTVLGAGVQVISNYANGVSLDTDVGKAAAIGFVSGAVGGATLGLGTAVLGTTVIGSVIVGAASGVAAGQAGKATDNLLSGRSVEEGLGQTDDIVKDAVIGGVTGGVGRAVQRTFAKNVFQNLVNDANAGFQQDPSLLGNRLTARQLASPAKAAMYGVGVENEVAAKIRQSPILNSLFKHISRPVCL